MSSFMDAIADRIAEAVSAAASRTKILTGTAVSTSDGHVQVQVGAQVWTVTDATQAVREGDLVVIGEQGNTRQVLQNKRVAAFEFPVGGMILWPGASAPAGGVWAICNGASYSSSEYPELYAVLGSTSLPNLQDRFPRGAGTVAVKSTGGSPTITIDQMPEHDHAIRNESSNIGAAGTAVGEEFLGSSTSRGWYTDTEGGGQDYWPKYYAVNYIIRML